jgi:hypothetical protein
VLAAPPDATEQELRPRTGPNRDAGGVEVDARRGLARDSGSSVRELVDEADQRRAHYVRRYHYNEIFTCRVKSHSMTLDALLCGFLARVSWGSTKQENRGLRREKTRPSPH